jgi:hypothetical protein
MEAFDPCDVYELLDVMDWWGPADSRFAPGNKSRSAGCSGRESNERRSPVIEAQPFE